MPCSITSMIMLVENEMDKCVSDAPSDERERKINNEEGGGKRKNYLS